MDEPQKEYDVQRDVEDVLTPGGKVRSILDGSKDPVYREYVDKKGGSTYRPQPSGWASRRFLKRVRKKLSKSEEEKAVGS